MPNKSYIKGKNHENYIKRKYENQGYACIRSSGSKGAVDVIALKKGSYCHRKGVCCPEIHAIQCKPKNQRIRRSELQKMKAWSEKTGIKVVVQ
jgi:Holliday junction resolvase